MHIRLMVFVDFRLIANFNMLSAARSASRVLLENSRQFSSLSLRSTPSNLQAAAVAQKFDVRYKSDGKTS